MTYHYLRFGNEIDIDDIALVGGKNASIGEMYQKLVSQSVNTRRFCKLSYHRLSRW